MPAERSTVVATAKALAMGSMLFLVLCLRTAAAENVSDDAEAPLRLEWRKVPIEVVLEVGTERQVQFPAPVKIGIPAQLATKLRAQSLSDTVYLQATVEFDPARIVVQTVADGRTYLLDVAASETTGATPPITLIDPEAKPSEAAGDATPVEPSRETAPDPVSLTRFAAQQLYAPARLLKGRRGIVRIPVHAAPVTLLRGAAVTAVPLIAWRAGALHLTAVKLTNAGKAPISLDPRALRGNWLTATFQHNRLLAAGDEADTTVVYLVSTQPFAEAL